MKYNAVWLQNYLSAWQLCQKTGFSAGNLPIPNKPIKITSAGHLRSRRLPTYSGLLRRDSHQHHCSKVQVTAIPRHTDPQSWHFMIRASSSSKAL